MSLRTFFGLDRHEVCAEHRCSVVIFDAGRCWFHWNEMMDQRTQAHDAHLAPSVHIAQCPPSSLLKRMMGR